MNSSAVFQCATIRVKEANRAMAEWELYNPNPAGRNVGDCAVRAVAAALGLDWPAAYARIAVNGYMMGDMPSSNSVWGSVLRQEGFSRYAVPNTCPDCYSVGDFADDHQHGVYVVATGGHVVTIRDGTVMDSWDSRREIPQFYWTKEE